jgi:NitT/TauT family transport system ATP-binding protein
MAQARTAVKLRDPMRSTSAGDSVITLAQAGKVFQTRRGRINALDPIDLSIRNKEFVCLLGPSGCGKSTVLNMIAGLIKPTTGTVAVEGQSVETAQQNRRIGLVFQDPVLLPWRTAMENAALPLEVLGLPRAERERCIQAILKLVGLEGFEHRFPHELSGGMRQRLGIARALSFDPQVLLMDEPFGALDALTRDHMSIELLRIWEQRQKTVLFVTHSISEAAFLSDRIVVLTPRPGRISAEFDNPLPRPRRLEMRDSNDFIALSRQLRNSLGD